MALFEINTHPSRRDLLWFGVIFAVFAGLVGGVLLWRFQAARAARIVWAIGVVLPALYYAVPSVRRPIYLGWLYAAWPLGWVISHLIVAFAYYLVITPIGLILRVSGRDPMHRRFDGQADSYWIPHKESGGWFRQF